MRPSWRPSMVKVDINWQCDLCGYDENPQEVSSCDMCGLVENQEITIAYHNRVLNIKDKETA
jgi:hypothetical protein